MLREMSPSSSSSRVGIVLLLSLVVVIAGCRRTSSTSAPYTITPSSASVPIPTSSEWTGHPPAPPTRIQIADFADEQTSTEAREVANWVVSSNDSRDLPFIIVDKVNAKVFVFGVDGRIRGASSALLGLARGDDSVPGIGERKVADIRPEERTTPAGRFAAEMGLNANGEDILWVDYNAAISLHRVRATNPAERRLQRLASPTSADKRISYGCINLPASFYDRIVKPVFGPSDGIVYVLPETRSAKATFGAYALSGLAPK